MDPLLKKMQGLALQALHCAYAPYSQFKVGACLLSDKQEFFTGCNVENAAYGLTLCAEASALSQFVKAGARVIKRLVVVTEGQALCSPCGACRQRLFEFADKETVVHFFNGAGEFQTEALTALLPFAFKASTLERS